MSGSTYIVQAAGGGFSYTESPEASTLNSWTPANEANTPATTKSNAVDSSADPSSFAGSSSTSTYVTPMTSSHRPSSSGSGSASAAPALAGGASAANPSAITSPAPSIGPTTPLATPTTSDAAAAVNVYTSNNSSGGSPAMIGAIAGAVAGVILLAVLGCCLWRRRTKRVQRTGHGPLVRLDDGETGDQLQYVEKASMEPSNRTVTPSSTESATPRYRLHIHPPTISSNTGTHNSQSTSSPTSASPTAGSAAAHLTPPPPSFTSQHYRPRSVHSVSKTPNSSCTSLWIDDSDMDVMAVDGSSYTRTLSFTSSTSTLPALPRPLSPTRPGAPVEDAPVGTYMSSRSTESRAARYAVEAELDHPGYTMPPRCAYRHDLLRSDGQSASVPSTFQPITRGSTTYPHVFVPPTMSRPNKSADPFTDAFETR